MKKFAIKAILFYALSAICALTILGLINAVLFWFFEIAGIQEFVSSMLFMAGLAITETSVAVYCVSSISEDVLYYTGEYEEDEIPAETTEEKAT